MPPSLVVGPPALINYKETTIVTLECVGVGSPAPTYVLYRASQLIPLIFPSSISRPKLILCTRYFLPPISLLILLRYIHVGPLPSQTSRSPLRSIFCHLI